jgi:hypothetical protein
MFLESLNYGFSVFEIALSPNAMSKPSRMHECDKVGFWEGNDRRLLQGTVPTFDLSK